MTAHVHAEPIAKRLWTPGVYAMLVVAAIGIVATLYRFIFGLGAATNLSDGYPWGIWKAISVAAGVAIATGGFTTAALVHVFHRERYEALVRPALLIALLGYTYGVVSLTVDIGRYYNIWHPAWPTMWQGNSALFEVAMCIMTYLIILYIEFIPIVVERFKGRVNLPGVLAALNKPIDGLLHLGERILGRVLTVFVLIGVVLSSMHHSSLGALMLVAPYKMDPLWYTPVLPLLFLLSVFSGGFALVVAVAIGTAWGNGRKPNMQIYSGISRYILILLGIYLIAKVSDLLIRDVWAGALDLSSTSLMFWLELLVLGGLPFVLLTLDRVRRSPLGLSLTCLLVVGGLVVNRINVFLTAYTSATVDTRYFPSVIEIVIMVGLASLFMFLYRVLVSIFPIHAPEPEAEIVSDGRALLVEQQPL
jgi:Ni/Fe-hydrogenase subunit HybB-like protein